LQIGAFDHRRELRADICVQEGLIADSTRRRVGENASARLLRDFLQLRILEKHQTSFEYRGYQTEKRHRNHRELNRRGAAAATKKRVACEPLPQSPGPSKSLQLHAAHVKCPLPVAMTNSAKLPMTTLCGKPSNHTTATVEKRKYFAAVR
jgi:hypothetical protein